MANRIAYRTCHLCEATCGLELHLDGREITLVRGDRDDVFSHGYLCPKGTALKHLEADPDRVRTPLIKEDGTFREATWDEAFALIDTRLSAIRAEHGKDALAVYLGNPSAHNLAGLVYNRVLLQAASTANVYSASTVDQMPKQVSAGLMFGAALSIPVPDVDRTDYLLMLGANPFESNGSLMTAPDIPGRLRALRERGGRFVVVDPRRTKTADEADEHLAIRPGTDALFLFAIVHVLFADELVDLGAVEPYVAGLDEVRTLAQEFAPEQVAQACGIDAATIRRVAHELAAVPTAAVYARIGTCTQEFGTLASWLVDVCNVLTGNLDRPGGAMFTLPATGGANASGEGKGRGVRFGRRHSRVRQLPEFFGEFPVVCLSEEIETPGEGKVRALVTIAGNPARSTPDSGRLERAIATLDFMVSIDIYVNETTRHADVILPPESELARGHYDLALYSLAIRNVANYSPPLVDLEPGDVPEWRTMLRLAAVLQGLGAGADIDALDDFVVSGLVQKAVARRGSNVEGRDPDELLKALAVRRGPERVLDFMLRTGPYGDGFGADPDGLSLDVLEANPHGVDLGALQPRLPGALRTPSGRVELAPEPCVEDVARLRGALDRRTEDGALVLVGRRDLRSNNSWMHNLNVLVKGKPRCTVHVHPDDAQRLGLADGADARVASAAGAIVVPVEVTDAVRAGVVSIPHGWGHNGDDTRMSTARANAGANSNVLARTDLIDPLSGNAVLNGIPVEVSALS
jgi:anaerobic selenocysteine-containing dehydrogenase